MYYFCRQNLFEANNIIEIVGHTEVTGQYLWTAGHKFSEPVPQQTLQLDPAYGENFPAFFDTTIPVMSDELVNEFVNLGVDNFDTYPMLLKRIDTGEEFSGFQAVNFVGSVDAVDLDRSEYDLDEWGDPEHFRSIFIDPVKAGSLKAFRLAEGPDLLVVCESVAQALQTKNFKALLLQPTVDFDGD